ncbi:MAG: hypothetical protein CEE38_19930 [Planctomycetes bacterium B3_Pla]|nr:MAG: hypothetical protein CEE38_19930 [Planctomycetes bacterium B3_Pla]
MSKTLLIGSGVVVAGMFVGFVTYKVVKKKCPAMIKKTKKRVSKISKKASSVAGEAKQAFMEGFEGTKTKAATA